MFKKTTVLASLAFFIGSQTAYAGFRLVEDSTAATTAQTAPDAATAVKEAVYVPSPYTGHDDEIARLSADIQRISKQLADTKSALEKAQSDIAKNAERQAAIAEKLEAITVSFAFGNADFAPSTATLKKLLENASKASLVDICGFADSWGTPEGNKRFAMNRALSAKKYLVASGIAESKIAVDAKLGNYIDTNDTEAGRKANRRVEINFIK